LVACAVLGVGAPAQAQWTRVTQLPVSDVFSLYADRDTIAAGTDTCVFVSTDAGVTWRASARVTPSRPLVMAVRFHHGRLYAGTANQGVFVSGDLGATWSNFNQGLVGGPLNSQLDISGFEVRGDSLFTSTLGAGVYVRPLAAGGTWSHFGEEFEPNQASNVNGVVLGGTRLLAVTIGNGLLFRRDPGEPEWTVSFLDNVGLEPGLDAFAAIWNGVCWVVGSNIGVSRSTTGQEVWTSSGLGLGPVRRSAFAVSGRRIFGAFDRVLDLVIMTSGDDANSWNTLDVFPFKFAYALATSRTGLYAARADGLWVRSLNLVSVSDSRPAGPGFTLAGRQPVGDVVRFRIDLPEAGAGSIDVFDVTGRRVADPIRFSQPAGARELMWDARSLAPGIYESRLTVSGRQSTLRLIHVR
jgi:hypothetical protein